MEEMVMGQERIIHAALLGAGTVGSGVYKLVKDLEEEIISKTGARLVVDKILVRDTTKAREGIPSELLIDRWDEILNDPKIEIVIEVMGGIRPALTWLEEALRAGKQVVTANKDLLAEYGEQLFDAAEAGKCDLHFEAAVAGAIPIIRPLRQSLAASELTEVMGIVNGTTNYILTRMTEDGMGYEEALALATKLGYAESDPTADVEGYDAGRKVAIMASIAFNSNVTFSQVYTEGITHITAEDIRYAKEFGYVIKLIGMTRLTEGGVEVKVHPMLLPEQHPLSTVRDSFNAVFIHGEACDDAMFMGRGAGQLPTASAVMGDVIDVMRNILHHSCGKIGYGCYRDLPVKSAEDTVSRFFLRIQVTDKPGALANIAGILGNNDVSIAQVVQKRSHDGVAELVIITDPVREKHFNDALSILKGMSVLKEVSGVIRVYGN
jgi:homoserine dehydrogenase